MPIGQGPFHLFSVESGEYIEGVQIGIDSIHVSWVFNGI